MFASESYPADPAAVAAFLAEMRHGTLIATPPGGHPAVSILPFIQLGEDEIELHGVQADPTLEAAAVNPRVTFFVSDFLAWTPHHWVSPPDAGKATLHFRAVALECLATVSTDPEDVAAALRRLVAAYEPDQSGYEPIEVGDFYGARLKRLAALRLKVVARHAKFKTGPAGTADLKQRVADRLRERAAPGDGRAADVIESYLKR